MGKDNNISAVDARIEDGSIRDQKIWSCIKELNSFSDEQLDSVVISDCRRDYTYRQMFREWKRYARVFSALGLTGKKHTRVAMSAVPCTETAMAFFGLNMTGASVSFIYTTDANDFDSLREIVRQEKISDLILCDYKLDAGYLRQIMREKKSLGISGVIMLHVPVSGDFAFPWEERESIIARKKFRKFPGILFMEDLLEEYYDGDIDYSQSVSDDTAVIVHTSGTTKGIRKPIPLSDEGVNETGLRHRKAGQLEALVGREHGCISMDLSSGFGFSNLVNTMYLGGGFRFLPTVGMGWRSVVADLYYRSNVIASSPRLFEVLTALPFRLDLSAVEAVILAGSYLSPDSKKRFKEYLKSCGSDGVILTGYGLTEAGSGCTLSDPDAEDDSVGYLLSGIKAKLYDEEKDTFYDIDGKEHTGVLYLNSPSVSCGHIDENVFFELEEIDGEKYLNTYDLFTVKEDGALYYKGRMNKFFVNDAGVRFDAGLVETAVGSKPGIDSCGLVPEYDKSVHDTIPVLYVKTSAGEARKKSAVTKALVSAYIGDGLYERTELPVKAVITDEIPYTVTGKVDSAKIKVLRTAGAAFDIIKTVEDDRLTGIRLEPHIDFSPVPGCDICIFGG